MSRSTSSPTAARPTGIGRCILRPHSGLLARRFSVSTRPPRSHATSMSLPRSALQPAGPQQRARMSQIIAMLDAYAYRPLVWDVAVERVKWRDGRRGEDRRRSRPRGRGVACADGPEGGRSFLIGDQLSLADLHAAPIIGYFTKAEEGRAALARHATISLGWTPWRYARATARRKLERPYRPFAYSRPELSTTRSSAPRRR